jgi:hypothetical protein
MVKLELTDDEARELSAGLEQFLVQMEREIAATDSRDFRLDLQKRENVIRDVTERLKQTAA